MSPVLCWIEMRTFELQLVSALGTSPVWLGGGALDGGNKAGGVMAPFVVDWS